MQFSATVFNSPALEMALKWGLTRLAPELAKKVIEGRRRYKDYRCDASGW
jgi:hypothetical protein